MEKVDNSLITSVGLINSRYYYTLEIPWFNRLSFLALRFPGFGRESFAWCCGPFVSRPPALASLPHPSSPPARTGSAGERRERCGWCGEKAVSRK